jgi:ectoine hydroxylase
LIVLSAVAPPVDAVAHRAFRLRSEGFVSVPSALGPAAVADLVAGLDRVYEDEIAQGRGGAGEPMHLLGGIGRENAFLELVDHPAVFPVIWGELGWNIHLYHCHFDVTPPRRQPRHHPAWGWHQDGGRQNLELECAHRPRMSLKVAFWLSDVSVPGRGNMLIVPGSHERNSLPRFEHPELGSDPPTGAVPVLASPGDALIFDRRLWHSRSDNLSEHTRRAIFLAYSYRWIRPRDEFGIHPSSKRFLSLSPVRRQLLGEPAGRHHQWDSSATPYRCTQPSSKVDCWIRPCRATGRRPARRPAGLLAQVSMNVPTAALRDERQPASEASAIASAPRQQRQK